MFAHPEHASKLVQTDFDKKSYMTHIKDYMARLLKKLEADGAASRDVDCVFTNQNGKFSRAYWKAT